MFKSVSECQKYIESFIPQFSIASKRARGKYNLDVIGHLVKLADNPQDKLKIIHVAATSGKGSTCYATAAILKAHGLKVGLSVSPHIIDIRERFMVDSQLISDSLFMRYLSEFKLIVDQSIADSFCPTYYELLMAFAYFVFDKMGVDIAVIETGCGGLLDGSNIAAGANKVCVLGKIGLDHTELLGDTLSKIAAQKAGIVHKDNSVVYLQQSPEVNAQFKQAAILSDRHYALNPQDIKISAASLDGLQFELDYMGEQYKFNTVVTGDYQAQNISLAFIACKLAEAKGWLNLNYELTQRAIAELTIIGRLHKIQVGEQSVIVDGAHNEQKMSALVESLQKYAPNQKYCIVIGLKEGKSNQQEMLSHLQPIAGIFVATSFFQHQDYSSISKSTDEIMRILPQIPGSSIAAPDINYALDTALKSGYPVLVTGSIYLLAEVYAQFAN